MKTWSFRIIVSLVGAIFFYFIASSFLDRASKNLRNKRVCEFEKKVISMEFEGLLIDKFRDIEFDRKLKIIGPNFDTIESDILLLDNQNLFKRIAKGDYIKKYKDRSFLEVVRGPDTLIYDISFNCE